MCNINVIIKKDKVPSPEVLNCMNVVSAISYEGNSHGDGFYGNDHQVCRNKGKLIYRGDYSFIVSHQRLATSGKIDSMIQPLQSKNFILVHNGIFRNVDEESLKQSDTHAYLKLLEEDYKTTKDAVQTIINVNEKTEGYYSCVLYDKNTDKHYYYKESHSNMYIIDTKDYRLMSTREDNVEYMRAYFGLKKEAVKVEDGEVIDLMANSWKVVGKFSKYTKPEVKSSWETGWDKARTRFGYNHTNTRYTPNHNKIVNPLLNTNPQELAAEFKEYIYDYQKLHVSVGVAVQNLTLGKTYVLKISVLPEDVDRFEDITINQTEVLSRNSRKIIFWMSLKSAVELMATWEGVSRLLEYEKGDYTTAECQAMDLVRDSSSRYSWEKDEFGFFD